MQTQKDDLIISVYDSFKNFSSFYDEPVMVNSSRVNERAEQINKYNKMMYYNYQLCNKAFGNIFYKLFSLKRNVATSRNYDIVTAMVSHNFLDTIVNNSENLGSKKFKKATRKAKRNMVCYIAKYNLDYFNKYCVHHKNYGTITLLELVYIIITLNYKSMEVYRSNLNLDFEMAM